MSAPRCCPTHFDDPSDPGDCCDGNWTHEQISRMDRPSHCKPWDADFLTREIEPATAIDYIRCIRRALARRHAYRWPLQIDRPTYMRAKWHRAIRRTINELRGMRAERSRRHASDALRNADTEPPKGSTNEL